jgi:hypothetical protein
VSRVCVHTAACDDVQVVPVGTRVIDPRTVVAIVSAGATVATTDVVELPVAAAVSGNRLGGDDVLIAGLGQSVIDRTSSTEVCEDGGSFLYCSAIKPGANGIIESVVGGNDALIAGGTGQRLETSDPLRADTDFDLYSDGLERRLGSSPSGATPARLATRSAQAPAALTMTGAEKRSPLSLPTVQPRGAWSIPAIRCPVSTAPPRVFSRRTWP